MKFTPEEVKENLRKWEVVKLTQMLNDNVPFEYFVLEHRTDILLESIAKKNIILFQKILKKNFNLQKGQFIYLNHAIRTREDKYILPILNLIHTDKAYLNKQDENGCNALHVAAEVEVNQKMLIVLSKAGVSWEKQNRIGQTPLHIAMRNYVVLDQDLVDEIIEKKISIDIADEMGITVRDIIKSFARDAEWRENEMAMYILEKLDIK